MDLDNPWKSETELTSADASVEGLGNASDDRLSVVHGKLAAICLMWRLGLSAEEQQTPEAAAVLIGMFNAINQYADLTAGQFTVCLRWILQAAAEAELSPLAVPPDDLFGRMMATESDTKLLPWSFYARRKVAKMQTNRLDVCAEIGGVVGAVKSGRLNDLSTHVEAH